MKTRTAVDGAVTIDPDVLGGAPVFTGSRVPIANLFDYLSGGGDLMAFLVAFPRVKREFAERVLFASSSELILKLLGRPA